MRLLEGRGRRQLVLVAVLPVLLGLGLILGDSATAANPAPIALPDMRIFVPTNLISIGVDPGTGHRQLRFTHITADIGAGPFEIDPHYNPRTGISTFTQRIYRMPHPGGWVADHSVQLAATGTWEPPSDYRFPLTRFTLNRLGSNGALGAVVAVSPKVDYCITGDTQVQGIANTPGQTAIPVGDCGDPTQPLGWSVGWGDEYDQTDAGQPIDLSHVPDGTYVLRATVDPDHVLHERTTANDVTDTTLRIHGDQVTVLSQRVSDVPLPAVRITAPAPRSSAWGTVSVRAAVSAPASRSVRRVQFLLDGQAIGPALSGAPYVLPWTLSGVAPGTHYLSARATDSDGVSGSASPVAITVTRGPAVGVRWLRWRHRHLTLVLSHRPPGQALKAVIRTRHGRRRVAILGKRLRIVSARPRSITLQLLGPTGKVLASIPLPLNARPAIRIANPSPHQTVFGIVPVAAQASDPVGVSSVRFFLDGHRLGPALTRTPYLIRWDTRKARVGGHVLSARVVDALGHTTSIRIPISVRNPAPPMTCFVLQRHVSAHGSGEASTPAFHTVVAGETLLAFVSADGPQGSRQRATVSGGGLHWRLVSRANQSPGDAEVWQAIAYRPANVSSVRAVLSSGGYDLALDVIAMEAADGTASAVARSGSTGAPTARLRTQSATSLIFAVGHDWDRPVTRTLPVGWVMLDQWLDQGSGDTSWTQYTNQPTGPAGSRVTVSDLAPRNDHWNLAAVELINSGD